MTTKPSKLLTVRLVAGAVICGVPLSQLSLAQAGNPQPAPLTGLAPDHATISVENLDRIAQWYERVLGFKVAERFDTNPDFLLEQLSIPGYRIDLVKYKGSVRPTAVNPLYLQQGWVHVVFNVQDLTSALKELHDLNVNVAADKDSKGVPTRLVIHDPEGNEIEVVNRR
jgi:catechol 2,3-dioxygenase-like lactoylglutathione lyase family enzyme